MTHIMLLHVFHYELGKSQPHNWDTNFKVQPILKSSTSNITYFAQRLNHSTIPRC